MIWLLQMKLSSTRQIFAEKKNCLNNLQNLNFDFEFNLVSLLLSQHSEDPKDTPTESQR